MNKLKLSILLISLLTSCNIYNKQSINIICPTQAPSIAFYNYANDSSFETNSLPINILGMMNSISQKNIVVIDTISGIKAIRNGAPYKIAATITFGNFYIVSTGKDNDGIMSKDDCIVLFGKNLTPDLIFHYIYGNELDGDNLHYVDAAIDAKNILDSGLIGSEEVDYVFLAQPAIHSSMKKNKNLSLYADIKQKYIEKSQGKLLVQASIFIKNNLNKEVANNFLNNIEFDIKNALNNPQIIEDSLKSNPNSSSIYGLSGTIAKEVIMDGNGMGLGFKKAIDIKEDIDSFLNLFSEGATDEKDYF